MGFPPFFQRVWSRKGLGRGLSDHTEEICGLVFCCGWYRVENMNEKMKIKEEKIEERKGETHLPREVR